MEMHRGAPPLLLLLLLLLARAGTPYKVTFLEEPTGMMTMTFDATTAAMAGMATSTPASFTPTCVAGFASEKCKAFWAECTGGVLSTLQYDDSSAVPTRMTPLGSAKRYGVELDHGANELAFSEFVATQGFVIKRVAASACVLRIQAECPSSFCDWDGVNNACIPAQPLGDLEFPADDDTLNGKQVGGFVKAGSKYYLVAADAGKGKLYEMTSLGAIGAITEVQAITAYFNDAANANDVLGMPRQDAGVVFLPITKAGTTKLYQLDANGVGMSEVYDFGFDQSQHTAATFAVLGGTNIVYHNGETIYFNAFSAPQKALYKCPQGGSLAAMVVEEIACTTPPTPSPATASPPTASPGSTPSPATPSPATPSPATPSPATASPATQTAGTAQPLGSGSGGGDDDDNWVYLVIAAVAVFCLCILGLGVIWKYTKPVVTAPPRQPAGGADEQGEALEKEAEFQVNRPVRIKKLPTEALPMVGPSMRAEKEKEAERGLWQLKTSGSPSGMTVETKIAKEKARLRGMVAEDFTQHAVEDWRSGQDMIYHTENDAPSPYTANPFLPAASGSPVSSHPYVSLVPLQQSVRKQEARPTREHAI